MIAQGLVCATLPTSDMARSRRFYHEALELKEFPDAPEGGVWYEAGGRTLLHVYESTAGPGKHTAATILVEDFEETIAALRSRGIVLEEYDLPGAQDSGRRLALGLWFSLRLDEGPGREHLGDRKPSEAIERRLRRCSKARPR
jgi:catechol 2,3-dioxygenase-like lactoylglutathione lyase family enzyme